MNGAQIHLAVNHLPILGSLFGLLILIFGMVLKQDLLKKTALMIFIVVGFCALPAYFSGDKAEKVVRDLPGVDKEMIETHEDLANVAFYGLEILAIFSIFNFITFSKNLKYSGALSVITIILSLAVFVMMFVVGHTGGKISHSELRDNFVQPIHIKTLNDEDDD